MRQSAFTDTPQNEYICSADYWQSPQARDFPRNTLFPHRCGPCSLEREGHGKRLFYLSVSLRFQTRVRCWPAPLCLLMPRAENSASTFVRDPVIPRPLPATSILHSFFLKRAKPESFLEANQISRQRRTRTSSARNPRHTAPSAVTASGDKKSRAGG